MFNIGWTEFLILVVAGLFILGPERLPAAAAWLGQTVRQIREYATGAREQLRSELGPEFDELRKPLEDLRGLRGMNPRAAVTRHLLDGWEDDWLSDSRYGRLDAGYDTKANGFAAPVGPGTPVPRPLQQGERPPFDPDAT